MTLSLALFSREEVLEGLPARRAAALLFLIESRTAFLVARSRQAMERFLTEDAARERERAFIEAFALGRDAPLKPTLQHLERFAPQWASLVPGNPRIRAALAHLIGGKYRLVSAKTSGIQAAVGWASADVSEAYERLYHAPIASLFESQPAGRERMRWAWAAVVSGLDSLPPFWTAFSLTLTETVGAGVLALPIGIASIGPLAGLAILVALGLVNVLTIMAMSEAVARSGNVRYGTAFVGRVVAEFLGDAGAAILGVATAGLCLSALVAYYVGFSLTLADATSLPPWLWAAVLFAVAAFFLSRGSLQTTVASALIVGAVNVMLVLALSALAAAHVDLNRLTYVRLPFVGGQPFDPSLLGLTFGVVLIAYFGHLSVSNCARVVLARDPSARSLIWGTAAAQLVTIVLYGVWVVSVTGAISPETLAAEPGTALAPLAREVGPVVLVLGTVFVVLGMGMASIHYSLGLFNLVQERLPSRGGVVVTVPRQTATVVLRPRGHAEGRPRMTLTFLAREEDGIRLRVALETSAGLHVDELLVRDRWDSAELERCLSDAATASTPLVRLELLDAWPGAVRLRIHSPLSLEFEGVWEPDALAPADLLDMSMAQTRIVRWVMRHSSVNAKDAADFLGWQRDEAAALLQEYAELGLLSGADHAGEIRYHARLGTRRANGLPAEVWEALTAAATPAAPRERVDAREAGPASRPGFGLRLGARGRFLLALAPTAAIFLSVEWLFFSGQESFSKPLAYVGVIGVSILGGIFPLLMLHASRRRGERTPGVAYRIVGHPLTLAGIYALFLAALLIHGTVIWQNPLAQGAALLAAAIVVVFTIASVRRRAFTPRAVLEIRQPAEPGAAVAISVVDCGRNTPAEIRCTTRDGRDNAGHVGPLPAFGDVQAAIIRVPAARSRQLKIWVHRITSDNDSEGLPATLEVESSGDTRRFELRSGGHPITVPLTGSAFTVTVRPAGPARAAAIAQPVPA
jgi:amino acid permease